jgi:ABC-2 type transport system permease protein
MIRLFMRLLPPGSFAWLTFHELRLALASQKGKAWQTVLRIVLLLGWIAAGIAIALALRGVAIHPGPIAYVGAAVGVIGVFSFMTTQALLASQRTLYEAGDLDLLFSAPLKPRSVLSAKLVGIVGTIAFTFAMLILPIAIPVAVLGHPELWGVSALLLALALASACVGLVITLILARIAGPRAARTVGQIVAALAGGSVFIVTQVMGHGERGQRSGLEILFKQMVASGAGSHGISAFPGRAAFGDSLAIGVVLAIGVALFVLTSWGMQTLFLSSYRAGGMKLGRTRKAKSRIGRHFRTTLFGSVYAKEWRLLARDPALAFQIVLRLVYLAPLFLFAFRPNSGIPLAPSLAFVSVFIAGQVVGSFAWLAVSAEDSPDLIMVAPVDKADINHAKLMAAMAMALPLFVLLPIVIARETIAGALVTLAITAFAGWISGQLEILYGKPAPRSTFRRRQSGSFIRGILEMILTGVLGGAASVAVYFLL